MSKYQLQIAKARLQEAHFWLMSEGLNKRARLMWKMERIKELEHLIERNTKRGARRQSR